VFWSNIGSSEGTQHELRPIPGFGAGQARPESSFVLRSAAISLVSQRLDRLLAPAVPAGNRLLNWLMVVAFGVLLLGGVLLTVAHTACCLVPVG
jgi:hypothetical protein